MSQNTIELNTELDPWVKNEANRGEVPSAAQLVCAYELYFGVDSISEVLCLHRTASHDELWSIHVVPRLREDDNLPVILHEGEHRGRVARINRAGSDRSAAKRLLRMYFRSFVGYQWPLRFEMEGLIDEQQYQDITGLLEKALGCNRSAASETESPIIEVARELGLNPSPTGKSPTAWQASCPEAGHYLYISSESDTFGCGYCKRKGGESALREFVKERRQRRQEHNKTR